MSDGLIAEPFHNSQSRHPLSNVSGVKWTRESWKSVNLLGTESLSFRVVELHVVGLITCEREGIVGGDEGPVGVSEAPVNSLAELRRLLVTESKLSEYMERKDRKKTSEVRGEVKGEVETTQRETLIMDVMADVCSEDEGERLKRRLEPMWV